MERGGKWYARLGGNEGMDRRVVEWIGEEGVLVGERVVVVVVFKLSSLYLSQCTFC